MILSSLFLWVFDMKPSRPYILKAMYEWLLDNDLTPHLVVNALEDDVLVPQQFVEDGQIVLNILPSAVRDFYMDDRAVAFNARFSGQPMDIYIPMAAIMAIYARENGQGMGFGAEPGADLYLLQEEVLLDEQRVESEEVAAKEKKDKKPSLRVIK